MTSNNINNNQNRSQDTLKRILSQVKVLPQTCPNHPHQHLISIAGGVPQCPIEAQHQVDKQTSRLSDRLYAESVKKRQENHYSYLKNLLYTDSLVSDVTIKHADFGNYYVSDETPLMKRVKQQSFHEAQLLCKSNMPHNIILAGAVGRGKSHLAMSILKFVNQNADDRLNNHNTSCLFIGLPELMDRFYADISNNNSGDIQHMIKLISNAYVVVLDDLGANCISKMGKSSYSTRVLYQIMNNRQNKRTIFTTNLHTKKLMRMFDPRVCSRILAGSTHHIISFSKKILDVRLHHTY